MTAERQYRAAYLRRQFHRLVLMAFLAGALVVTAVQAQTAPAAQQPAPTMTPVLFVTQVTPPPEYASWYAAMERCIGMRGNYKAVRWYLTARPWSGVNGTTYGMWQDGHRITLNAPERLDSSLVSHEALHDILADNGLTDPNDAHPAVFFGPGKCAYRLHPVVP